MMMFNCKWKSGLGCGTVGLLDKNVGINLVLLIETYDSSRRLS